jgi:hypothetical protein
MSEGDLTFRTEPMADGVRVVAVRGGEDVGYEFIRVDEVRNSGRPIDWHISAAAERLKRELHGRER